MITRRLSAVALVVLFAGLLAAAENYRVGDRLEVRTPNWFLAEIVAVEGGKFKVRFPEKKDAERSDEWVEAEQFRWIVVWKPGDAVEAEIEKDQWKRATVLSADQVSCSVKLEDGSSTSIDGRKVRTWIPVGTPVEIDCNGHTWHGPVAKVVGRDFVVRPKEEDGPAECWVYSGYVRRMDK